MVRKLLMLACKRLEATLDAYKRGSRLPVKATDLVTEDRLVYITIIAVVAGVVTLAMFVAWRRKHDTK